MAFQSSIHCPLRELALFAGAGEGILGGRLLGWETVCAVERDAYAASVLAQRQNDGLLPPFPIWSDVTSFDGQPWRGIIDVISGGFPCQDISVAGKGDGLDGERSGLWKEFARIIGEVRPRFAYIENSPALIVRGLDRVLCDLAALGFNAEWGVLSAADLGAHHIRERIWILAYCNSAWQLQPHWSEQKQRQWFSDSGDEMADSTSECQREQTNKANTIAIGWQTRNEFIDSRDDGANTESQRWSERRTEQCAWVGNVEPADICSTQSITDTDGNNAQRMECESQQSRQQRQARLHSGARSIGQWRGWPIEPDVGRVAHGVAARVDRIKCLGNAQVPKVAAAAFIQLLERIIHHAHQA